MITGIEVLTGNDTETDNNPIVTHIIDRGDDKRQAQVIVLEARVNGTPIKALCGHVFIPERDPLKYPPCDKCVEIYEFAKDFRGVG